MNYYNEFDPNAAQWLRNLIAAGLIPAGYVDDRSILDVKPSDLAGYTQCHFFAGIGGWPLALSIAGISHEIPLWTGSPPCQPFSVAGLQKGSSDPRHLAPAFLDLVAECRPVRIYGEQVAAAVTKDDWLDALCCELEAQGYLFAASVLPAAGVGAAHKRERLFFGAANGMVNTDCNLYRGPVAGSNGPASGIAGGNRAGIIVPGKPGGTGGIVHVAYPDRKRLEGFWSDCDPWRWEGSDVRQAGLCSGAGVELILCRDGKTRPVESGIPPLANGVPKGVGRGKSSFYRLASRNRQLRLKGYGNAIVPAVAAQFITAFERSLTELVN